MLAENYVYTKFNQEMKKLYDAGEIGEARYAEGQYNHPMSPRDGLFHTRGWKHWRNNIPSCYYNTHALAPMMHITNTMPVEVSGMAVPSPNDSGKVPYVMIVRMDNGAIFRIMGGGFAGHSCWYGFHGTVGAMEMGQGHGYFGPQTVRVWHDPWDLKEGQDLEKVYMPQWQSHAKEADKTGHGGGDFFVELNFVNAIKTGVQPYLNALRGITMTNVGILAWRSMHQKGDFIRVPDLTNKADQEAMLKDRLSPLVDVDNSVLMPPEMLATRPFNSARAKLAREVWKEIGYTDAEIEEMLKP
jgi:predicted dehydrogenase